MTLHTMSYAEYAALPGVRWSALRHLLDSPAHYLERLQNPPPSTDAQRRGRLIDAALFGGVNTWHLHEFGTWRTKAARDWRNDVEADGGEWASRTEHAAALACADAVRRHPLAGPILRDSTAQATYTWTDAGSGLACKARPDLVGNAGLWDCKSISSTRWDQIVRSMYMYRYDLQLAHYWHGAAATTDQEQDPVGLIFYEVAPPFDVCVVQFDATFAASRVKVRELYARLVECQTSGVWPGRESEVQWLCVPGVDGLLDAIGDDDGEVLP